MIMTVWYERDVFLILSIFIIFENPVVNNDIIVKGILRYYVLEYRKNTIVISKLLNY